MNNTRVFGSKCNSELSSRWSAPSYGARVVFYSNLIENAFKAYQAFLNRSEEAGRIVRLLDEIDESLEA